MHMKGLWFATALNPAQSCQGEYNCTTSTINRIYSGKILITQGQVTLYPTLPSTPLVSPHFCVSSENSDPQVPCLPTATAKQMLQTGPENTQKTYYLLPRRETGSLKCIHIN